jgi:anaerobic magnesium-protoporphyrin IX monomethyl ester cyclase
VKYKKNPAISQHATISYRRSVSVIRVLLINPPLRTNVSATLYPIGICYVASYLREHGHKVQVLDINGFRWTKAEFVRIFSQQSYDAVGIGGLVTAFNHVDWITTHIRSVNENVPIFAGNTVASTIPHLLLDNTCVDIAVMGEGEITALELVDALESGKSLQGIKGIQYKNHYGRIVENPGREPIKDLDGLPLPAFDLVPMEIYLRNFEAEYGFRGACMSTVRGCPFNCRFCCKTFVGYKVRSRSPENVVEEIKVWIKKFDVDGFFPCDDLFIYDRKRALKFCDLLIGEGLNWMKWFASARVDLLSKELALKLKQAGCVSVDFGFESHSQRVLDYYNKLVRVEHQQRAIDICKDVCIPFKGSYIVGARNEDEASLEETYRFCEKNRLSFKPNNLLMPQPQTAIYEECKERGLISDELAYVRKLASAGDTDELVVNVTEKFSDEGLLSIFHRYRFRDQLPSRRISNVLKDPEWTFGKLRQQGVKGSVLKALRIVTGKDLRKIETLKTQTRNEWN